uniref:ATP synthase F0 subunit 6 n=1 Tax=Chrysomela aeneicollis TaxID=153825 RepID=UPI0023AAB1BE|nr:ATP synthase F0 subunit 6 [Chrysomela aeneicollis]WCB99507.1 ATP synthase F0 subunit 6 [Chrysomela aeneicollis]
MMMNLFSSFDPSTGLNLSLNWLSSMIGLIIIPPLFWLIPSRLSMLWLVIILTLHKEFKVILNKNSQGSTLIFVSLFMFILMNNFLGLFPYIFTSTSHMILTLSMALPLWLSFMIYGWSNHTMHMLIHLVPQGTPGILMPFMVCIETISNIIRPGTLAIRLSANMIAGHLLLMLLSNTGPSMTLLLLNILLLIQILLLSLEFAVSIIQSYVFVILGALYSSETN